MARDSRHNKYINSKNSQKNSLGLSKCFNLVQRLGVWAEQGLKVLCCHTETSDVTKIIILLCGWEQKNY